MAQPKPNNTQILNTSIKSRPARPGQPGRKFLVDKGGRLELNLCRCWKRKERGEFIPITPLEVTAFGRSYGKKCVRFRTQMGGEEIRLIVPLDIAERLLSQLEYAIEISKG